jgi:hypothetical protein
MTKYNMNDDQMMQTDTPQQASYIRQTPQQASYAQQETHQTTYMPQIPILPQQSNYIIHTSQAATISRAQSKQQTSQNQKKTRTAMTMTTPWQSVARKEHAPEPQKCQQ